MADGCTVGGGRVVWVILGAVLVFTVLWLGFGLHWIPALALAYLGGEALSIVVLSVMGLRKAGRQP